jgi:hypothetical protein
VALVVLPAIGVRALERRADIEIPQPQPCDREVRLDARAPEGDAFPRGEREAALGLLRRLPIQPEVDERCPNT